MSRAQRDKGARERDIVELRRGLVMRAVRVPLSDAARHPGNGAGADIHPFGPEGPRLCGEVKARVKASPPSCEGWATTTSSSLVEATLSQLTSRLGASGRDSWSQVN
jgi:hypothetical protein